MTPSAGGNRTAAERFGAEWLALREPVDHRARAECLLDSLRDAWRAGGWSRVLDLGSGTGSNLRYLADRLPGPQTWILVDHDAALLARAEAPEGVGRLRRKTGDLAEAVPAEVRRADLVTASALLDLVSEAWLRRLVDACRASGAGALLAMTYAGDFRWSDRSEGGDPDPDDALVREAVNRHQRRDKGLGSALGPEAAPVAEELFCRAGYRTRLEPSPWRLGPDEAGLARTLIEGWEAAAREERPDVSGRIRDWARRRRESVDDGTFALVVEHLDLLALPPDPGGVGP